MNYLASKYFDGNRRNGQTILAKGLRCRQCVRFVEDCISFFIYLVKKILSPPLRDYDHTKMVSHWVL
jgi:hypothetical protein